MNKRTGLLCQLGLHRWCKHPEVESVPADLDDPRRYWRFNHVFRCKVCRLEHEHCPDTGRFLPVEDVRVCVRCGEVRR